MNSMQQTTQQLAEIRVKICSCKFIHVMTNDKFSSSIVKFIHGHFAPPEHCFLFCGGHPEEKFPIPEGYNIFKSSHPAALGVSEAVSKVIFHGLYDWDVILYLNEHPEIMAKSYWIPWGGDLYDAPGNPVGDSVRGNFRGVGSDGYTRRVYRQKYGTENVLFPFDICFEPIEYARIIATPIPQKQYVQIQVNNSAHHSTLEALHALEKFKAENILVTTVLSYGGDKWSNKICDEGKRIFDDKFIPIQSYIPPDMYIKLLARNDILILNQHRPQGLTTAFTSMLLGQKVFMRCDMRKYLDDEGYTLPDTRGIPELSFEELCANPAKEENKRLAARRFDPVFQEQCWRNLFDYEPPKPGGA